MVSPKDRRLRSGRWTSEERELFEQAVIRWGWSKWTAIANNTPNLLRGTLQIKAHAQKFALAEPSRKEHLLKLHCEHTQQRKPDTRKVARPPKRRLLRLSTKSKIPAAGKNNNQVKKRASRKHSDNSLSHSPVVAGIAIRQVTETQNKDQSEENKKALTASGPVVVFNPDGTLVTTTRVEHPIAAPQSNPHTCKSSRSSRDDSPSVVLDRKRKSPASARVAVQSSDALVSKPNLTEDGSSNPATSRRSCARREPDFLANGGVDPPTKDVLRWQRLTMSEEQHRRAVIAGLRVKVLKNELWRGGLISNVGSTGVEVSYSDSNSEWHNYPSVFIIIDDTSNGHHHLAARGKARAFVPPSDDNRHAMALAAAEPRDEGERKEEWMKTLCKKWSINYAEPREGIAATAREREFFEILLQAWDNERAVDDLRNRNLKLKTSISEMREERIQLRKVVDLFSQSIINRDSRIEVLSRQLNGLLPPHVTAGEDSLSEADTEFSEPVKKCKTSHGEDPDCPIVI